MNEISQEEINYWLGQGFTMEEINSAITDYNKNGGSSSQQTQTRSSYFSKNDQDNLGKAQIDVNPTLERIEHLLRGDKISYVDGNVVWICAQTNSERMFNDFGVACLMEIVSAYLNPVVILSNFKESQINEKMLNFGITINDLIFMNYEEFGLDSYQKRSFYRAVVNQLKDIVHATYLRALNGEDRSSLRRMINVNQNDPLGGQGMPIAPQRSVLNPMRYLIGRYK